MAISNFVPELWNAGILTAYQRVTIFGQPSVSNRQFEGQIKDMGDTVHVNSLTDPTIRTYSKTTDITVEDLTDSDWSLVIDQGNYFAFRVNDIDEIQAAGDFRNPAIQQAGYGLNDTMDKYVAGRAYADALAGNKLGRVTVVNDNGKAGAGQTYAYNVLVSLRAKLDAQSVPTEGRYVVVDPDFVSALLFDPRFVQVDQSGDNTGLRNGIVTRGVGFDVLVSNNIRTVNQIDGTTGANQNDKVIVAGVPGAITVAQQLVKTEALRSELRFADVVRGLNVYGAKVFRPAGVATATVTYAAGTGT